MLLIVVVIRQHMFLLNMVRQLSCTTLFQNGMLTPMFLIMMEEVPCIGLLTKVLLIVHVFCCFLMYIEDDKTKRVRLLFIGLLLRVTWRFVLSWYRLARRKT